MMKKLLSVWYIPIFNIKFKSLKDAYKVYLQNSVVRGDWKE